MEVGHPQLAAFLPKDVLPKDHLPKDVGQKSLAKKRPQRGGYGWGRHSASDAISGNHPMDFINFPRKRWFQSAHHGGLFWFWEPRPALPVYSRGSKTGAAMWTSLLAFVAAAAVPAIVVIGLFRLAALKRPDDLKAPSQADEWASSHELQTPK